MAPSAVPRVACKTNALAAANRRPVGATNVTVDGGVALGVAVQRLVIAKQRTVLERTSVQQQCQCHHRSKVDGGIHGSSYHGQSLSRVRKRTRVRIIDRDNATTSLRFARHVRGT